MQMNRISAEAILTAIVYDEAAAASAAVPAVGHMTGFKIRSAAARETLLFFIYSASHFFNCSFPHPFFPARRLIPIHSPSSSQPHPS